MIKEENLKKPDFTKMDGLIPAIVQDANTNVVLMLGFMDEKAYVATKTLEKVTFYSRSKKRQWTKGETSGNYLHVQELLWDCDQDTLLVKALPEGPVCHTGAETCFMEENTAGLEFLNTLQRVIRQRKNEGESSKSYVKSLFEKGINKIAQKVGEEAVEVVIEAKDNDENLFKNEAADLLFHYLILLEAKGYALQDIVKVLESRHK